MTQVARSSWWIHKRTGLVVRVCEVRTDQFGQLLELRVTARATTTFGLVDFTLDAEELLSEFTAFQRPLGRR